MIYIVEWVVITPIVDGEWISRTPVWDYGYFDNLEDAADFCAGIKVKQWIYEEYYVPKAIRRHRG